MLEIFGKIVIFSVVSPLVLLALNLFYFDRMSLFSKADTINITVYSLTAFTIGGLVHFFGVPSSWFFSLSKFTFILCLLLCVSVLAICSFNFKEEKLLSNLRKLRFVGHVLNVLLLVSVIKGSEPF